GDAPIDRGLGRADGVEHGGSEPGGLRDHPARLCAHRARPKALHRCIRAAHGPARDPPALWLSAQLPSPARAPGAPPLACIARRARRVPGLSHEVKGMRTAYVVTYDICEPKRLRRVYRIMLGYGDHLQYSVFRCELTDRER